MLVVSQNKLKIINAPEQLILITKGGQYNQEVEIRPSDAPLALATYNSKDRAIKEIKRYSEYQKEIFKLKYCSNNLSEQTIKELLDKYFVFEFMEE